MEVYNVVTKKWETVQSMTKKRSAFNLVVVEDELYAVGGEGYGSTSISIEKLDKELGVWRVVAEIGEVRRGCGAAAVGSKIFVFGANNVVHKSTWNAFDVITEQWASASISVEDRRLPRDFFYGQALTVPPMLTKYT